MMHRAVTLYVVATICVLHMLLTEPSQPELLHERGLLWQLMMFIAIFALTQIDSMWTWLTAAGAVANLVDSFNGSVEDPFLITTSSHYLAFNFADVCAVTGMTAFACAVVVGREHQRYLVR